MSFALTTDQVRRRTKTVTRRMGWRRLKPGTLLQPIVKGQGIPKGGHVETIGGPIRVLRVDSVVLGDITPQGRASRGLPVVDGRSVHSDVQAGERLPA